MSSGCFKDFTFITRFSQFDCDVLQISACSCAYLLNFLDYKFIIFTNFLNVWLFFPNIICPQTLSSPSRTAT